MTVEESGGRYDGLTREQLVQLLEKRERTKKLGLVWERDEIEADKAVDAKFVACTLDLELCERPAPWRNLVIEGDNFDVLRWLRIGFSGRVNCIYIDPPYNTGNKDWVYNDHYFDSHDRYRHSTWLEFLFRRLSLARDLLSEDGVILISINDENRARLELLADEALPGMRIGTFVWRTKDSSNDAERNFSSVHEHVLVYGRPGFSFLGYELSDKKYKNPDGDLRGKYSSDPIIKGHSFDGFGTELLFDALYFFRSKSPDGIRIARIPPARIRVLDHDDVVDDGVADEERQKQHGDSDHPWPYCLRIESRVEPSSPRPAGSAGLLQAVPHDHFAAHIVSSGARCKIGAIVFDAFSSACAAVARPVSASCIAVWIAIDICGHSGCGPRARANSICFLKTA
jgi:hypothetical protein